MLSADQTLSSLFILRRDTLCQACQSLFNTQASCEFPSSLRFFPRLFPGDSVATFFPLHPFQYRAVGVSSHISVILPCVQRMSGLTSRAVVFSKRLAGYYTCRSRLIMPDVTVSIFLSKFGHNIRVPSILPYGLLSPLLLLLIDAVRRNNWLVVVRY